MLGIGVMQGRLSPPLNRKIQSFPKTSWRDEFMKVQTLGLGHIEWIFEEDEWEKNPLSSDIGIKEIQAITRESGVPIISVCADFFLDVPYLRATSNDKKELCERLEWLVVQAKKIEAKYIDLPFVDASTIDGRSEYRGVKEFVSTALKRAEKIGVVLALETALPPKEFQELLRMLRHPNAMANYDTGNSAALGYDVDEEWFCYGQWVRTVHVKDRKLQGGTVPLGTGNTDFKRVFTHLLKSEFEGPLVLQPAREGDEMETAKKNKDFVSRFITDNAN
jgi:L-ribulose-5-phosphate 3-epimerase